MAALGAMLSHRPYVVAFLIAFLVVSAAERGFVRTAIWLVTGTFLGWLSEFVSLRTGFPYGMYVYHVENFPDELWLGGVPLFASLSFAFLTYFGFSVAQTLLFPLKRVGADIRRLDDPERTGSFAVLWLAAVVTTWMDTAVDPVSHLGRYWFLGDLYAYSSHGFHFGVPLSNYAGWMFTSACIVFVNQRLDCWLSRRETRPPRLYHLPWRPLWAVGICTGNFCFMLAVNLSLLMSDRVPDGVPLMNILLSGSMLTSLFVLYATYTITRRLREAGAAGRL